MSRLGDPRLWLAGALALGLAFFGWTGRRGATGRGPIDQPFAFLYEGRHLPIFELTIPESSYRNLAQDPFGYQPAHFTYRSPNDARDKVDLLAVGVRLKGQASFMPINRKPSLKIRFDKYLKRQRLFGLRSLTLNNMAQDPSKVRERLAYHVFRRAGIVAPLCNNARVFVNGQYYGLYANVQTVDRVFLGAQFGSPLGNLYDLSREAYGIDLEPAWRPYFVLETNRARNDTSDLDELIDALDEPQRDFVSAAESMIDLDQWLTVGAVQAIHADWDSYFFGGPNNYSLYHHPDCACFLLVPQGVDQTFGIQNGRFVYLRHPIGHSTVRGGSGLVFRLCRSSPACYERYLDHVERTLHLWEGLDLPRELERIVEQIRPAVLRDRRRGGTYLGFENAVDDVRRFLRRRGHFVRRQIAAERLRLRAATRQDAGRGERRPAGTQARQ